MSSFTRDPRRTPANRSLSQYEGPPQGPPYSYRRDYEGPMLTENFHGPQYSMPMSHAKIPHPQRPMYPRPDMHSQYPTSIFNPNPASTHYADRHRGRNGW